MITPSCKQCRRIIPSEDVNVANDVAFCRACNVVGKLSELVGGAAIEAHLDPAHPPEGAWHEGSPLGAVIGATHRSVGAALGLLAASLFWNGIVSVFVLVATSSTLRLAGWPMPDWFPAPKMNPQDMGVGMTIFLWIFLTPFIVVGLCLIAGFLLSLGGRTEIRLRDDTGMIFTGIGPVGYRRRFRTSEVVDVRIDDRRWRDGDGDRHQKTQIVIETRSGRRIKFGDMLRDDRMKFMAGMLRSLLVKR